MTHYDQPPEEVHEIINKLIDDHYPDLKEAAVKIDVLFAFNDKTFAVKCGGYPALAVVKINSLKARFKGQGDAEIIIDGDGYEAMSTEQREAVCDHELHHILVQRDKEQNIKRDDLDRPKFRMKKHDYQLGWFREIAERHGQNSPEVYQAKLLWNNDGKTFFPQV